MMKLSNALKTAAVTGLFGLGMTVATMTPALAHYSYTRCDNDGDTCWRVVCDNDGDDCHRVNTWHARYNYDRRYNWGQGYYDRDNRNRHWVCDSDGDRCHWSYDRW